uniref:RING-type E3 ubiquitin transferase n=1 Tax=Nelumbo nucifera TaxID=4432 RepID=A0A823A0C8_NELNU|nr:TPA_asm: hypothetical protein HUJ06_017575 [Nelumbo nucifera]
MYNNNEWFMSIGLIQVEVLSRVRHPNIVSLIGVCPENYLLVYEYLPSGTLEDRLNCKDDTSPLSWQIRTRIAAEICSAIIFLHSNHPYRIVHGNLRPENVLLDENLVSKLCGFGNSGLIPREGVSPRTSTPCRRIDPIARAYVDPEFVETQELTPASDVYSFGVILLLLLTGGPAMGIVQTVKSALNNGTLDKMLDESAGSWPLEQAKQLIYWALKCCEEIRQRRPDLELITITLERLKQGSCGASSSSSRPISESEPRETPSHFLCPIFQETMRDPRMAADGYTYEYAAIREWLDRGHDTSPMTNLPLINQELTPNLTLRSAIQEWLDYS